MPPNIMSRGREKERGEGEGAQGDGKQGGARREEGRERQRVGGRRRGKKDVEREGVLNDKANGLKCYQVNRGQKFIDIL